MNDSQIIAIAIIFVAALGSIMYNNSRISDLRDSLGKRMDELRTSLNQHIEDKFQLIDQKLDRIIDMLAGHDSRLQDHETRLQKLEGK